MTFSLRAAALAVAVAVASLPHTPAAAIEPAASDAGARMLRLADNVYMIEHDDATDEWPHGNTGVIVGRTGLFVIDSCYLPSRARDDIALIRRVTDKPVRFLAMTHWHFDHDGGAVAYRDAFPGVALLAERNTARWVEQNHWKALDAGERERRKYVIAQHKAELAELAALEIAAPTQHFDGRLSLGCEGTTIEIMDRGPANSPLPYVGASWPVHWARVLRDLEAMPVAFLVPGHGPVMADQSYTKSLRELLDATLARVEALVRAGRSLAQVQDELDLDDLRSHVPDWSGPAVSDEDWTYTRRTLAERAFRRIRGQGGR